MATATATAEDVTGDLLTDHVSEEELTHREGRLLDRRFDMRNEAGKAVLSELIKDERQKAEPLDRRLIRRMRFVRAFGGGGIFLSAVIDRGRIVTDGRSWAEIIRDAIEWLISEEGRAFIESIIELVVMIITMIMGSL